MKRIIPLIEQYNERLQKLNQKKISKTKLHEEQIFISKKFLHILRIEVRKANFKSTEEEIIFFKHIKPKLCADLIFFKNKLQYEVVKPKNTKSIQKQFIKNKLKKLESKKRKNIEFYRYYKQKGTILDKIY